MRREQQEDVRETTSEKVRFVEIVLRFSWPHALFPVPSVQEARVCASRALRPSDTHAVAKHMRASARPPWKEDWECRVAGRGLVFTLISHRLSSGCQTLRPPPVALLPSAEFKSPWFLFVLFFSSRFFPPSIPRTMTTLPDCTRRLGTVKAFVALNLSQYLWWCVFSSHWSTIRPSQIETKKSRFGFKYSSLPLSLALRWKTV